MAYTKTNWNDGAPPAISAANLNKIEAGIENNDTWNATQDGRISAVEGQVTTLEGNVTSLEGRATSLEGRATALEGSVTSLEGRADAQDAKIATLETDVKDILPTDTASGAIASFPDGSDLFDYLSCICEINPVQDLHGYDSPWVGGAGKNKLPSRADNRADTSNGVTITFNSDGSVTLNGTATATTIWNFISNTASDNRLYLPQGDYIFNGESVADNNFWIGAYKNADSGAWSISSKTNGGAFSLEEGDYIFPRVRIGSGVVLNNVTIYPMIRLASVSDATYEPYENLCPITGWTGCNVVVSPTENAQDGTTYPVSWQTEAGTVYGGTLDLVSGVLTVTQVGIDMGSLSWSYDSSVPCFGTSSLTLAKAPPSNNDKAAILAPQYETITMNALGASPTGVIALSTGLYMRIKDTRYTDATAFKASLSGQTMVYELATPTTYQLDPVQVACLLGQNNVWADCGDTSVTYKADVQRWVEKKLGE